jgi:hypothetical protein
MRKLVGPAAPAWQPGLRSTAAWSRAASAVTWASGGVPAPVAALGRHRRTSRDVFAAAAAPYAERRPHALMEKVDILERTDQIALVSRTP